MIAKTILFTAVAMIAIYLIGRGLVWLYFTFKREADDDHQATRAATQEMKDARADLEAELARTSRKGKTK